MEERISRRLVGYYAQAAAQNQPLDYRVGFSLRVQVNRELVRPQFGEMKE